MTRTFFESSYKGRSRYHRYILYLGLLNKLLLLFVFTIHSVPPATAKVLAAHILSQLAIGQSVLG
jgi:hypothetical protein